MAGKDEGRSKEPRGARAGRGAPAGGGAAGAGGGAGGPLARVPRAVLAAAGLALLLVIFFNPLFFTGKVFQPPDEMASRAHRPFIEESFGSGGSLIDRYPLWTPYIFSGMPSFGSLTAAPWTNPMSVLLGFLRGEVKVVAYYLLTGIFLWLLLRRRGSGDLAAFVGAASFVFCTHLVTMIMFGHNSKIATLVFLPIVVLATAELWERPSIRWTSVLALAVGTMLVTSHLQIAYYTLLAAGLYLLLNTVFSLRDGLRPPGILLRWGAWIAGFGTGFAASSVVVLSVREYSKYSIRGGTDGGLAYDYATNWSLHPLEMTTFFIPSFFGFGQGTYWGWMPFTDFPLYMGILPLLLAVWTVAMWPRERLHVFLWALGALALLTAFGKHLPLLYNLLFEALPYFNKFRVPSMITVLVQFSVAALAALGLGRLLAGLTDAEAKRGRRRFVILAGAFGAIVAVLGALGATGALNGTVARRIAERTPAQEGITGAQIAQYGAQVAGRVADMIAGSTGLVLVVLAAGCFLIWMRIGRKLPAALAGGGVLVLIMVDLWVVGARPADYQTRTTNTQAFAETPAVRFLQSDPEPYRVLPLTGQGQANNWFAYFRIPSILGYHPAKLQKYQDLIDDRGPVGLLRTVSQGNFNVLDMLNTKYVVADERTAAALVQMGGGRFTVVQPGAETVLRNERALPRMWFVTRTRVIPDEEQHLAALAATGWNPRQEAILFGEVSRLGGTGTVTLARYAPRELDAVVEADGDGLLVLSEVYYAPGWHAFLDGKPVPIHRANYVLRAVEIPAGRHELRMRFDPGTFVRGAWVSAGAYLVAVAGLAGSFLRLGKKRPIGS